MDYQSIITSNYEYFNCSNIWMDIIRSIGWAIIKFLAVLSNAAEEVFNAAFQALDFTDSTVFKNFLSEFSVFIVPMLTVSFLAIGMILIFSEKKPPVLKNVFIGLAIIYVVPTIITYLNEGIISAKNDLLDGSMTTELILSNVSDLNYISNNGFQFTSTLADTISDTDKGLRAIDPTAHINPKDYDTDLQKQVFSHYLSIDDVGSTSWEEFESKGMFDIFDPPYYYRYNIHYFQIILFQIANILIFIFSAYAVVRMVWEIVTTSVIQAVMSMELTSGQKTKKVLEYFFNAYVVLLAIPGSLKIYLLWQQYVNTTFSNGIVRVFLIIFAALVVVDGPSSIEKIFGYDMGMSNGAQKVMAFMRTVQQARSQHHMMHNSKSKSHANNRQDAVTKAAQAAHGAKEPSIYSNENNQKNSTVSEPNVGGNTREMDQFTHGNNANNFGGTNVNTNTSHLDNNNAESNQSDFGAENEPNINNGVLGEGEQQPGNDISDSNSNFADNSSVSNEGSSIHNMSQSSNGSSSISSYGSNSVSSNDSNNTNMTSSNSTLSHMESESTAKASNDITGSNNNVGSNSSISESRGTSSNSDGKMSEDIKSSSKDNIDQLQSSKPQSETDNHNDMNISNNPGKEIKSPESIPKTSNDQMKQSDTSMNQSLGTSNYVQRGESTLGTMSKTQNTFNNSKNESRVNNSNARNSYHISGRRHQLNFGDDKYEK